MENNLSILFTTFAAALLLINTVMTIKNYFRGGRHHHHHHYHPKPHHIKPVLVLFNIRHQLKQIHSMQLNVKQFLDTILGLVDHDTQAVIPASFANTTLVSDNEAVATISDVNADGVVDIVGVSEGTANITVTTDVTYTDGNTGQEVTASKSVTVPVTVTLPPPQAENVDLIVTLGPAQDVPAQP